MHCMFVIWFTVYIGVLVQDCSNPSALAMLLLEVCTKLSIYDCLLLNQGGIFFHIHQDCFSGTLSQIDMFGVDNNMLYENFIA